MNILFIDDEIYPLAGGSAERTLKIASSLVKFDHNVDLLSLNRKFDIDFAKSNGINNYFLLKSFRLYRKYYVPLIPLFKLNSLVKKYDVVHISKNWSLLAFFIAFLANYNKIPFVYSPMGFINTFNNQSVIFKKIFLKLFTSFILNKCKYCIVVSKNEKKDVLGIINQKSKVILIPNGFVGKDFISVPENNNFRNKNNLSSKKIILSLSRMDPIKGIHNLISGFIEFQKTHTNWQLVIVGGPKNNYYEKLKNLSFNNKDISFINPLFNDKKIEAYYACDLFIIPSIFDAMTIIALEAAACRKPIIISKSCDFDELFDNNACLQIIPNQKSIKEALERADSDPELLNTLAKNAQNFVYSNYEWNLLAKKYNETFSNLHL
jgi:glycosyltransferase involved in cell wall biosynthesis